MFELEKQVAGHYTTQALLERILAAVEAGGGSREQLTAEDLKGVDEFHTGGLEATQDVLQQLQIDADTPVLDIGCGIGGTARHVALTTGAQVTGVDLTEDYVATARELSRLVGLGRRTTFLHGSALRMPVEEGGFGVATMFHVGMNIADKARLMDEAARVLAPGGTLALFDVMRLGEGELGFPFPWAEQARHSFVEAPEVYRSAALSAGLSLVSQRERAQFALDFFARAFAAAERRGGPAPLGIHLLMRGSAAQKLENYVAEVRAGRLAPVEMIFVKR